MIVPVEGILREFGFQEYLSTEAGVRLYKSNVKYKGGFGLSFMHEMELVTEPEAVEKKGYAWLIRVYCIISDGFQRADFSVEMVLRLEDFIATDNPSVKFSTPETIWKKFAWVGWSAR